MDPKPLTKDRLLSIGQFAERHHHEAIGELVEELLADARYWREAVKNCGNRYNSMGVCKFCESIHDNRIQTIANTCKPDCPWLLAQED